MNHREGAPGMEARELSEAVGADVIALTKAAAEGTAEGAAEGAAGAHKGGRAGLKILGTLISMSVPQGNYPRGAVLEAMEDAGLDEVYAPREPSARDAFRRATRSLAVSRVPMDAEAPMRLFGTERRHANVLIRDARTSGRSVVRLAVREVVDSAGATLSHRPVVHLELRGDDELDAYPLVAKLLPEERGIIEGAAAAYGRSRETHDDAAVRNVITRAFDAARGLSLLPSGGSYFVPADYETTARAVGRFVGELNDRLSDAKPAREADDPDEGARAGRAEGAKAPFRRLIFIPTDLVDKGSARDDLAAALAEKVRRDARGLAGEMAQLLTSKRKVTERRQEDLFERVRALKSYVSEYEGILERAMTENRADLELAQRQAVSLLSQVGVK